MDPRTFDTMIRQLSGALSRRSLVGGSLGASVLAAAGLGDDAAQARKKRVGAEACILTGKRCPSKKPRGKKGKTLGCDDCCQGVTVTTTNAKGKKVKKCSCKPLDSVCTPDKSHQCCSGVCAGGVCASSGPAAECRADGLSCTDPGQCCTQICGGGVCGRPPDATCAADPDACADGFIQCGGSFGADVCYCYLTPEGDSRCVNINQLTHPNCTGGTTCNSSADCDPGEFCAELHGPTTCCTAKICGRECPEFG